MTREESVLEYIREHPGETLGSISAAFPRITAVSLLLCRLADDGRVRREKIECRSRKSGRRYSAFAYYIMED